VIIVALFTEICQIKDWYPPVASVAGRETAPQAAASALIG
jgi:hypothetical protein